MRYVLAVAPEVRPGIGPIVDCNVHLWNQGDNPVFWLSDRTVVRDMLGDYDSLPDRYTSSEPPRGGAFVLRDGIDLHVSPPIGSSAASWPAFLVKVPRQISREPSPSAAVKLMTRV